MRFILSVAGTWIATYGIALIIYGISLKRLARRSGS